MTDSTPSPIVTCLRCSGVPRFRDDGAAGTISCLCSRARLERPRPLARRFEREPDEVAGPCLATGGPMVPVQPGDSLSYLGLWWMPQDLRVLRATDTEAVLEVVDPPARTFTVPMARISEALDARVLRRHRPRQPLAGRSHGRSTRAVAVKPPRQRNWAWPDGSDIGLTFRDPEPKPKRRRRRRKRPNSPKK